MNFFIREFAPDFGLGVLVLVFYLIEGVKLPVICFHAFKGPVIYRNVGAV